MSPQKKNRENSALPPRWRYRFNAYWYRVPADKRGFWDNKAEFRLGSSLSEAHTTYAERIKQYQSGAGQITTMAQLIERYLIDVTPTKAKRTQRDEPKMLDTLRQVFGNTPPALIESSHIYTVYDKMKVNRGLTTANRHMELLSSVFTKALRWGAISEHPMLNKQFQKEHPQRSTRYIEDWEIIEALTVAPPLIRGYVNLKWLTGLRQTDMLSLTEHQIRDGYINVQPSKTEKHAAPGIAIEITDEIQTILDYIRSHRQVASIYLFCTRKGQPYIKPDKTCNGFQSIWGRWMRKAVKQTELEASFKERDIRAKTGTDKANRESLAAAQDLLAHSDQRTTRRHYIRQPVKVTPLSREKRKN